MMALVCFAPLIFFYAPLALTVPFSGTAALLLIGCYCNAGSFKRRSLKDCLTILAEDVGLARWSSPPDDNATSVELKLCEEGITLYLDGTPEGFVGSWKKIGQLWKFADCWMLIYLGGLMFVPLPTIALDDASKTFIDEQLWKSGGVIRENPRLGGGLFWMQKRSKIEWMNAPTDKWARS